jgi:hypothetical protein
VPTQAPISFTDPSGQSNYQCDTCASLNTPFSTSEAVATDVHGNFSIRLPSFGAGVNNLPYLIIQTGRWRRVVKNTAITGCTNNTLPIASTALPANSSQGDIPKIALVTADQESAECFLRKVGISASEISAHSGSGDTTRITLYRDNGVGQTTTATIPQYSTTLLNSSSPTLWNYSVVMWPCDGSNPGSSSPGTDANGFQPSSAQLNMMLNFANAGGRFFMDHYAGQMWAAVGPSAWQGLGGWDDNGDSPNGYPAQGKILNGSSSSDQQAFFQWASTWDVNVGNSYGAGYIQSAVPREVLLTPSSAFLTMVEGESNNNWSGDPNGNYVLSGWYNTPVTASAGSYCGRVVFNDMHVSSARAACSQPCSYYWPYGWSCWTDCSENASFNPSVFPTFCQSTSLTSEELALEYQFFEVSACNLGVSLPVPPPPIPAPPPALVPTTFTRTFQAGCLPGYSPKWGPFQWQANIPTGTSISFTAQTAPDATGGGAGTYGTAVPIGTASTSTSGWTPLPPSCPVAGHLGDWANAGAAAAAGVAVDPTCTGSLPAQTSQDWLQVSITFNPSTTQTPTLLEWQQLFDCVP